MATHEMKLRPFPVPDSVTIELPPGLRQDGMKPLPTIPVQELSDDTLEDLVVEWLGALYASRGKASPFKRPVRAMAA